jgi:thymidylate synthase
MTAQSNYGTFGEAYRDSLKILLSEGRRVPGTTDVRSPGSRFGESIRDTIELTGYSFKINDPLACLLVSKARPLRIPYCIGSLVWTLNGSDNLEEIVFYNLHGRALSDDGVHLSGAFGKRLFHYKEHLNQIDVILNKLKEDNSSRRTTAMIAVPEDQVSGSREYPCAVGLQYLLREGRLDAITFMRSQSAALVLPYDSFLFMSLQCVLSQRLGVEPGSYVHFSGSFHLYLDELDLVQGVIKEETETLGLRDVLGPSLAFDKIRDFERHVRQACERRDVGTLNDLANQAKLEGPSAEPAKVVLLTHAFQRLSLKEQSRELADRLNDPLKSLVIDSLMRGDA